MFVDTKKLILQKEMEKFRRKCINKFRGNEIQSPSGRAGLEMRTGECQPLGQELDSQSDELVDLQIHG